MDKTPARIAGMFDRIAPRYDLLNRTLSVGLDQKWRRRAIAELQLGAAPRVLDLCTGTADLAIAAMRAHPGAAVVGIDFAGAMLQRGLVKVRAAGLDRQIHLIRGDATTIPLADASCDAVTIGFGIRNVAEPQLALGELGRVLRPGARLAILEFGEPRIPGIRTLYRWYFQYLLPLIGRLVSRHDSAYSYLPASVHAFPRPPAFARLVESHGFVDVRAVPLTAGIVYLYVGTRAASSLQPTADSSAEHGESTPNRRLRADS